MKQKLKARDVTKEANVMDLEGRARRHGTENQVLEKAVSKIGNLR